MSDDATRARVLPVVMLALVALAVLKAANVYVGFSAVSAAPAPGGDIAAATPADASAPRSAPSEAEKRILNQLAERRAELEAREEAVATREKLLAAAEYRLEARLADLTEQKRSLETLAAEEDRVQEEEFSALSDAYEKMKARDAARIFDVLEEDILVPVASGMRTQALAGVLAEMNPDNARRLTRLLADRSAARRTAVAGPQ